MVRDTTEGKIDYTLVLDGPMFKRWAEHLTKGAKKYAKRNWMKATGQTELDRFKESALRHFIAWFYGERDEDHAAAVIFNINGAEYVQERLERECGYVPVQQPQLQPPQVVCKLESFLREPPCPGCARHGRCLGVDPLE